MNPLQFTNAVVSVAQPLQGLMNVTEQKGNKLFDMQVEDTELRLLIADLYSHLGVSPRQDSRVDAQNILMHVNQEQAYQLAQQKFMERQYAYMNGSVLERFRRFIGGHPLPPMNQASPYGYQQGMGMPMLPPQGMNMYQQGMPQGYPMAPPAPAQNNQEFEDLKNQVTQLTDMMGHIVQNMKQGQQGGAK